MLPKKHCPIANYNVQEIGSKDSAYCDNHECKFYNDKEGVCILIHTYSLQKTIAKSLRLYKEGTGE